MNKTYKNFVGKESYRYIGLDTRLRTITQYSGLVGDEDKKLEWTNVYGYTVRGYLLTNKNEVDYTLYNGGGTFAGQDKDVVIVINGTNNSTKTLIKPKE